MDGKVSDKGSTPRELVSSAYQYHNERIMERLAKQIRAGRTTRRTFSDLADKLKMAFNRNSSTRRPTFMRETRRCGYVLALQFGLVPEDQRDGVIANLVDDIMVTA